MDSDASDNDEFETTSNNHITNVTSNEEEKELSE